MKISIYNFKSITSVIDYEIKPLTVLSGINSSGKSSFIQLLLLLKETLDLDSSKFQLYLDGELYEVKNYLDILHGKNADNKLKIAFEINKEEFQRFGKLVSPSFYDNFDKYTCKLQIEYDVDDDENVVINQFHLNYNVPVKSKPDQFIDINNNSGKLLVNSNVNTFGNNIWNSTSTVTAIKFSAIFPTSYDIYSREIIEGQKKGEEIIQENIENVKIEIDSIKSFLTNYFEQIYYIGPLREKPKDTYMQKRSPKTVGMYGENVAQILENNADLNIDFIVPNFNEEGIIKSYDTIQSSLIEGVKYWMCNIFQISQDIYSKKLGDSYIIYLVNASGIETTIKHVGFGISQILPVIVEGLMMPVTGTLILEQPEIHLHPKVQSLLFDFLYTLTLSGKTIIIETHSDHLITRMRRRIAEDLNNGMVDKINLTFIESEQGEILFKNIPLDDFGTSEFFPENFIEKSDRELRSIVKAQMKKRLTK